MREKLINSVKAFLPRDKEVVNIIRLCDLFPTTSWKFWIDSFGNTLRVHDNKQLSWKKSKITSGIVTDIFIKSHPVKIANKSYWSFFYFDQEDIYIYFFGKDNKLRLVHYHKDRWKKNIPPLTKGIRHLRLAIATINSPGFFEKESAVTGHITKGWSVSYPFPDNMKEGMIKMHGNIVENLLEEFK